MTPPSNHLRRWLVPALACLFFSILIGPRLGGPAYRYDAYAVDEFAELPVQVGGRIKPLDSVARVNLMLISDRQSVKPDQLPDYMTGTGSGLTAIEWFMDVAMRPERAADYRVFKITFPDDLGLAGLAADDTRHYSFNEIQPYLPQIVEAYENVDSEPQRRNAYERQVVKLHDSLVRYQQLMQSFHPVARLNDLDAFYSGFQESIAPGLEAFHAQQAGAEFDEAAFRTFMDYMIGFQALAGQAMLRIVPPGYADAFHEGDWANIGASLMESARTGRINPWVLAYGRLTVTYRQNDTESFIDTLTGLRSTFRERYADQVGRVHFEAGFNAFAPFLQSTALYILVFLITSVSWLRWPKTLGRLAFWLIVLTFLVHTFGLLARMYIQGRPPVTNLYASAIFVGWGSVLLCIVLEAIYRNGIGNAAGALIGFATLIVAHNLALASGDTLEMVRAVLDSNFWLATHVVVITKGYAAMFVAGALAIFFILKGVFSRSFHPREARRLESMIYGVICFAALFSLVGTILGGIWADQSWGRFWGWDPKENGALLIVLITAIILHVRWGRLVTARGVASLAIFGNIVTSWSWFGTNMLGVGLHSYGFIDKAFIALLAFWGSQILLIVVAALPFAWWRSEYGRAQAGRIRRRHLSRAGAPASSIIPASDTP